MRSIPEITGSRHIGQSVSTSVPLIHTIDPRAILCVWGVYILAVLSLPKYDITGVLAFAAFPVFVISSASIPIGTILKRLGLLSPFVLMMAAANPFFDRTPLVTIHGIAVSGGFVSASVIVAKSVLSITAILTLLHCVPFYRLCTALRDLRVPEVFVTQLLLLYRYSHLLVEEAMALQKARNLRAFGRKGKGIFTTAKLIGSLLIRTVERAERIYKAMLARGFSGTMRYAAPTRFRNKDTAFIAAALISFFSIRWIF